MPNKKITVEGHDKTWEYIVPAESIVRYGTHFTIVGPGDRLLALHAEHTWVRVAVETEGDEDA